MMSILDGAYWEEEMRPKTHRDMLRAMSDVELAAYIASRTVSLPDGIIRGGYIPYDEFYQLWLDWLRQEAK